MIGPGLAIVGLTLATAMAASAQPAPAIAVPAIAPVLVDGRCDGEEWRAASSTAVSEGTVLLAGQDDRRVYLCVPLPPDSYGTMDLYVLPAGASQPINLHASAQVGERQRHAAGWPDWSFGNHQGWYSPPVAVSSSAVVDGRARLVFGVVSAREVAIDKRKFGPGPWRVLLEIRALGADKRGERRFPADGSEADPGSWATLALAVPSFGATAPGLDAEAVGVASAVLGETRPLWLHVPSACRGGDACDVLVVLDADLLFPLAVAQTRALRLVGRMQPLIIAGLPSRSPEDRLTHFTVPPDGDERIRYPTAGGAHRFLQFLEQEVRPAVIARTGGTTGRWTLAGHSLAGLFAVEAMAGGASFDHYVAISPTLGWHRQHAVDAVAQMLERGTAPSRRLYVSVAADTPPYLEAFARLEREVAARRSAWLVTALQRRPLEDHVTTVGPSLQAALTWLFVTPLAR